MGKIDMYCSWMVELVNNPLHGYDQQYRWGEKGDYDCSSAVISALEYAGIQAKTKGATYTGNMYFVLMGLGFADVTKAINIRTGSGLKKGDILLNHIHHVAVYIGDGKIAQASINEKGKATGGQPGDQTGYETNIRSYYNYPWNCVLRYNEVVNGLGTPVFIKQSEQLDIGFNFTMPGNKGRFKWLLYDVEKGTWETLVDWTASNWISLKKDKSGAGYLVQCQLYDLDQKNAHLIDTKTIGTDAGTGTVINGTYANTQADGSILIGCSSNNADVSLRMKVYNCTTKKWFTQFDGQWASFTPDPGTNYIIQFEAYAKDGTLLDYKAVGV